MTSCIRRNGVLKAREQKILQDQITNMHNPNMAEMYEGLVTDERGLKRSRNSLGGEGSSRHQPSSSSEYTNDEEVVHGVGTSQRGGRGSRGGRRDGPKNRSGGGPKTRGGGGTNKRGRGGLHA
ncbi:glycine-rich RNA-binding protein 7-like [Papaver somniferum]|uniref:glycine-rich RNA-binding protein 7-like n=1 Tax=Papaver somniferum TaxID=3469 RepID=UPI000E704E7A|nr:glycine-rich RNA-binding protein 7-like [Papaver somniferum]